MYFKLTLNKINVNKIIRYAERNQKEEFQNRVSFQSYFIDNTKWIKLCQYLMPDKFYGNAFLSQQHALHSLLPF